ncbi:MAG: Calx-beta domain-containing protein [Pseudomonadota bacterium]
MNSRNHLAKLLAVSLLTMCSASSVMGVAATYTVDSNADTADGSTTDGECGQTQVIPPPPFPNGQTVLIPGTCSLRAAIQQANANPGVDTILFDVAATTGTVATVTLTSDLPAITEPVLINAINANNPGDTITVDAGGQFALLSYSAGGISAGNSELSNITLTGGLNDTATGGGAIYFGAGFPSKLMLNNVVLDDNTSVAGNAPGAGPGGPGGAISVADGNALVVTGGSRITNNSGTIGGGIYITSSANGLAGIADATLANASDDVLTLSNVVMSGNAATAGNGGAVYADLQNGGDINVTAGDFGGTTVALANTATADGGGFWISKRLTTSDIRLLGATVRGNTAANGGGIAIKRGMVMLTGSTLSGNTATAGGGGLWLDDNVANVSGGSARIENVTISNNTANNGAGIGADLANPASSSMIHSTIASNTAAASNGGGIRVAGAPNLTFPGSFEFPFTSNIVALNTGLDCFRNVEHTDSNNSGYNLGGDMSCGFTQTSDRQSLGATVLIGALANNQTAALPLTRKLLVGSPAIDASNPVWANAKDQRAADAQDGGADGNPGNNTVRRDIGAVEFGGFGLIEFQYADGESTFNTSEDVTTVRADLRRYGVGSAAATTPSVIFNTFDVTTNAGGDYEPVINETQTFTAGGSGQFSLIAFIDILNDAIEESSEVFRVVVTAPTQFADLGALASATVTINDAENGSFQFSPLNIMGTESADGLNLADGSATLTITRTIGSKGRVRVSYSTGDDTCTPTPACRATTGSDYTATPTATVVFEAGETSKAVSVALTNDAIAEPLERFRVNLTAVACINDVDAPIAAPACDAALTATVANRTATVSIADDDGASTVMINDPMPVPEGISGNSPINFTITLIPASSQTVTVSYATANGSATTADGDYTALAATVLSFMPGETSKIVTVNAIGDTKFEGDETFVLNLSNVTGGGVIGDNQGTGTIANDEDVPTQGAIGFVDDCVAEPAKCAIQSGTETATPLTTKTFAIRRIGNNGTSTTAAASFAITAPAYSTFGTTACTADAASNDYFLSATGGGTAPNATTITVASNGTGTVTFNGSGATEALVNVQICNDTRRESHHLLNLALSNATNDAVLGTAAAQLSTSSDEQPRYQLTQTALSVREGSDLFASFTVEALDAVDGEAVCIPYKTIDGPTGPNGAVSPGDYAGADRSDVGMSTASTDDDACGGALRYPNGDTASKSFSVMIFDDGATPAEPNETFTANLLAAAGGTVLSGSDIATVTIVNQPRVYLSSRSFASTDEAEGRELLFTITREGDVSTISSTVQYQISTGTGAGMAGFGTDFTTANGSQTGTVTFAAGATTANVRTTLIGDSEIEGDETFTVTLSNPNNASQPADSDTTPRTATGTITDDDFRFELATATTTVDEGVMGGNAVITVNRIGRSLAPATVDFAVTAGTATAAVDYTVPASATVSFPAGSGGAQTISIPLVDDPTDEVDETFAVAISNPSAPGTLGTQTSNAVTIIDNDEPPTLRIAPVSISEGDVGTKLLRFTATLSAASAKAVMATATTADGTAKSGSDYSSNTQMLMFPAGTTSVDFDVTLSSDTLSEADETFTVTLSNPSNATFAVPADATAAGTIVNDDAAPSVTLSLTGSPLAENAGAATLTATLSVPSGQDVTVNLAYTGTATSGTDYSGASSIVIPAGASGNAASITLTATNDTADEADETFTVDIDSATNATEATAQQASGLISDDDGPTVALTLGGSPLAENGGTATLTATLSAVSPQPVSVNLAYSGTATNGTDYTGGLGSIVIAAGSTSGTITLTATADGDDEADETVLVDISSVANASEDGTQQASGVISDDDGPSVSIGNASVVEGSNGTTTLSLPLTLSAASAQDVTVSYSTSNGSATGGSDYTAVASGTATIAANSGTSGSISITVASDLIDELDETLTVTLGAATNATLGTASAIGTISDDDTATISIADAASVAEGGSASFAVTLSNASDRTITLGYSLADGSATAGSDYTLPSPTQLVINAGETSGSIVVATSSDSVDEADGETFTVTLDSADNGAALPAAPANMATGRISDDDDTPSVSLSLAPSSFAETGGTATLTAALTGGDSAEDVVVALGYTGGASRGIDYSGADSITIPAGSRSASIPLAAIGDEIFEGNETLAVVIGNISNNATPGDVSAASGSIIDDEGQPNVTLAVQNASGNESRGTAEVVARLSTANAADVTVSLSFGGTASFPDDYSRSGSSVVVPAGALVSNAVTLNAVNDSLDEANETVVVAIAGISGDIPAGDPSQVTVPIVDDDAAPALAVADASMVEGNSGTGNLSFVVSLSAASSQTVTVAFATADGTATAGGDYTASSGTLSFAPGETSKTVLVTVSGDTQSEASETLLLNLSAAVNAAIADDSATGTIGNDDAAPTLSIADSSVVEGSNNANTLMRFTLSLSTSSSTAVTVSYATVDGVALAGEDYTAGSGTLTIPAGQTSTSFTVPVTADSSDESSETFTVMLGNASVSVSRGQAVGTISDDDTAPASASASDGQGRSIGFSTTFGGFEGLVSTAPPANAPANLVYDNGFFTYTIAGLATGGSATVTVRLPAGSSVTTYVNCPSQCITDGSGDGQTVTFTVVDGGPGDADGVANGRILIKAGGAGRAPTALTGGNGGGGGSFGSLSLLALASLLGLRRRRAV